MGARLPAHLEVSAILRMAQSDGGFGTVVARGERDAGTILLLTLQRGGNLRLWERMPQLDGSRSFEVTNAEDIENPSKIQEYIVRRSTQDPDCWIIELDIDDADRFVASLPA
ncbi:hypothetical protein A9995_05585 [Erythrobacter sp. QSSC1-22B]|uniref:DUF1491 family protein n=1 Tax=Erythrobacter sp. QSSC1-22B TaxID=1860125 RepID=UPI000804D8A1|nr:DUF1491 family protein [Erythrobacter sp. QSSC1-22B]OBX20009.1 hypothetical protein A9995_05585 [Erythrobacter sp. QSSC1-22B]